MLQSCHCCCCWQMPLATASRIIAITLTMISSLSVIRGCVALLTLPDSGTYRNIFDNSEAAVAEAHTYLLLQTASAAVCGVCCVLLAVGVSRQEPCLVIIFLVVSCLFLTFSSLEKLYSFFDPSGAISEEDMATLRREQGSDTASTIVYVSLVVWLSVNAFLWYLWVVVLSYYSQLTGDIQRQREEECRQIPVV